MKSKLKVGIAGYGIVGKRRRKYIDESPHMETVAVCDQSFKEKGVTADGIRCFANYLELVNEPLEKAT